MRLLESKSYKDDLEEALSQSNLDDLNGKKIFITGGLGLVCSTIVDVLICYGKTDVYVGAKDFQRFYNRFGECKNVQFVKYDALNNISELPVQPDYIIHGAGLASAELYISMPVETLLSNFDGLHSLLEYAKNSCLKRLIYISSSEVYGKKKTAQPFIEGSYGEIDIDNIRSSYAIAKRASEMLCKAYTSEYGIDTVIVRPGHIYGPSAKITDKRISSEFAYKAANGENLEMKSAGLQKRSYCYSIDCAIQILTAMIKGKKGEVYNIGHDDVITIKQMAEIYADEGNVDLTISDPTVAELKVFNPMQNSSLDNSKIKQLGYKDIFAVEYGLRHTVKILRELSAEK